jgi:predicted phosphoribosyltransferase
MGSIGQWYDDFTQVTDDQVVSLLERATTPE